MSSASGVGIPSFQPPQFTESAGVLSKIEGQVGNINQLFAEVQQLLGEMQALQGQKPRAADFKDKDGKINQAAFGAAMQQFQAAVGRLNARIEHTYRKLGQAQALLQRLQSQDLPAAERRDAEKMKKALDQATETLKKSAEAIKENEGAEESSATEDEARIEIRVIERNIDIRLTSDPSFKDVIQAFALLSAIVGDPTASAKGANPTIAMPKTPGGGLPPIGTP